MHSITPQFSFIEHVFKKKRDIKQRVRHYHSRHPESSRHSVLMDSQSAFEKRRWVYCHGKRAKHVGITPFSKFKETNPTSFQTSKIEKLIPWIKREFQVICKVQDVDLIVEWFLALIQQVELQSDKGLELLNAYLYPFSELFVHELICFARSPLNMETYDATVQYE